jgi:branched-chain amino acid transport system permease protein
MKRLVNIDLVTPGVLITGLAVIALAASFATPALQRVATEALIYVVVVVGLYLFSGNSGVVSFGHVSFMVIGAYVSALLTLPPEKKVALLELPPALLQLHCSTAMAALIASAAAGTLAAVVGLPIMRLRGVAPSMALFALLIITHVVAQNWKAVTGGRQALVGLPLDTTLWTALAAAAISVLIATVYQQSRHGALLRCARENEVAAESIGIDIARERMVALVLSAMLCALGGVLFAHFLGTLNPNTFYLDTTFLTLAMLVVGGLRSLSGAVAGVLILSAVSEVFRALEEGVAVFGHDVAAPIGLQEVALALLMLTILIFRPDGLFRGVEIGPFIARRLGAKRREDSAASTTLRS